MRDEGKLVVVEKEEEGRSSGTEHLHDKRER
jgi:hypothetical protein